MKTRSFCIGLLTTFLLVLNSCKPAADTEYCFSLKEHIGLQWRQEHVSIGFEPEIDNCHPDSILLVGPDGNMPSQLSNIKYALDGKSIISADLHFILPELDALGEKDFFVRYGGRPRSELVRQNGLSIAEDGNIVTVDTGAFGADLIVGSQTWVVPALADEIPGPLAGMRLADGRGFGGSSLYGATGLKSWKGELTANGPVFAEFTYLYEYENGVELDLTARIYAGDTAILWDMDVKGGELPKDSIRFTLSSGLPALTFVLRGEFYSKRGTLVGRDVSPKDLLSLPLEDYPRDWSVENIRASQARLGLITRLTPWSDWWDDSTQTDIVLRIGGDVENSRTTHGICISSRNAGGWVEPAAPGTSVSHGPLYARMMSLMKSESGEIYLEAGLVEGKRYWSINTFAAEQDEDDVSMDDGQLLGKAKKTGVGRELNRINDLVLYWPEDEGTHPRLYVTRQDIENFRENYEPEEGEIETLIQRASLRSGNPLPWTPHTMHDSWAMMAWILTDSEELTERLRFADLLPNHMGRLGKYDLMRSSSRVAVIYDLMIDSDLISAEERPVLQAQMAYLVYHMASPENWSMERGYMSGNLNMSVAHVLNLAILAATIPDHPMAETWSASALAMMDQWLDQNVGPAGEFLGAGESQANYAPVSAAKMITYGIVATRAGFRNFVDDPRLRALAMCLAKQMTPPDVRFPDENGEPIAGTPASGRGPKGNRHGLAGMMARATAGHDPDYSSAMQWSWNRTGNSNGYLRDRMAGIERIYMNTELPERTPEWDMDVFPRLGVIMRHALGTDNEWYINFLLEPTEYTAFNSESGGFPGIWARGVPISVRFGGKGYGEREELLISRVLPARRVGSDEYRRSRLMGIGGKRSLNTTSALSRQHYFSANIPMHGRRRGSAHYDLMELPDWPEIEAEGNLPVDWQRQLMFVRDNEQGEINYIVLRDSITGGQPTMWQFWTLSEKIGTPDEVKDIESFLEDKPGDRSVDARPIEGDRFTAVGQWGVDVDYYIAAPADTPRHTLRWGTSYHIPMQHSEYQDMLHLQMPGDGAYYVVLFPRDREYPLPEFDTIDEKGLIIRISGDFGTDHVFLSGDRDASEVGNIGFEGTAASVQDRDGTLVLAQGAGGSVRYNGYYLSSVRAAQLYITGGEAVLEASEPYENAEYRLELPGEWRVAEEYADQVKFERHNGVVSIWLDENFSSIRLVKSH